MKKVELGVLWCHVQVLFWAKAFKSEETSVIQSRAHKFHVKVGSVHTATCQISVTEFPTLQNHSPSCLPPPVPLHCAAGSPRSDVPSIMSARRQDATHCETSFWGADLSQADRGVRVIYKKRYCLAHGHLCGTVASLLSPMFIFSGVLPIQREDLVSVSMEFSQVVNFWPDRQPLTEDKYVRKKLLKLCFHLVVWSQLVAGGACVFSVLCAEVTTQLVLI